MIGCGGLGVPAAWTLAHAGACDLLLVDDDVVEESNLHRQVLYDEADLGLPKAERLAAALQRRFAHLTVTCRQARVTPDNAETVLRGCETVLEGTDDAGCKFAVSDWAAAGPRSERRRVAAVAAAIGRRGQWMVIEPRGACYRCLFEEPPPAELLASCAVAGVLGPVVGAVGAMAARSLLRVRAGRDDPARSALVRWLPTGPRRTPVAVAPDCWCEDQGRWRDRS